MDDLERRDYNSYIDRKAKFIATGVTLIILGLAFSSFSFMLFEDKSFVPFLAGFIFFLFLAVAVLLFVYVGIQGERFEQYPRRTNRKIEFISSIVWLVATIIYIILGSVYYLWHPGWIIFILAMVITKIVEYMFYEDPKKS